MKALSPAATGGALLLAFSGASRHAERAAHGAIAQSVISIAEASRVGPSLARGPLVTGVSQAPVRRDRTPQVGTERGAVVGERAHAILRA